MEMEAGVVTADAPSRALAIRSILGAVFVKLGARFVPELVASARAEGMIAIVAGPIGKGPLRRRLVSSRGRCEDTMHGCRRSLPKPRHERLSRHPTDDVKQLELDHSCEAFAAYVSAYRARACGLAGSRSESLPRAKQVNTAGELWSERM